VAELARLFSALPVGLALPATFAAFAVLLVVVWSIPRDSVIAGAPDGARWRDLRLWATALVVVQLGIYLLLA
jgi:uncharacterized membrane protein